MSFTLHQLADSLAAGLQAASWPIASTTIDPEAMATWEAR
jgi:hypothetical protein